MAKIEKDIYIQYRYLESDIAEIEKRIYDLYKQEGNSTSAIKKLQVYLKPEEFAAYFVINDSYAGKVDLFGN